MFGTENVTVLPREVNTENGNNPAEINTGKRYFFVYLSKQNYALQISLGLCHFCFYY